MNRPKLARLDRGEPIGLMEPLVVREGSPCRAELTDLALELAQKSAGFRRSLPESLTASLADLVRAMNCYYSNLIEGHDTHPVDIERALKNDYSEDRTRRDLQLEAKAHITVQQWIDGGALWAKPSPSTRSPKSTAASAQTCPTICSGSKTRRPGKGSRSSPRSARPRCQSRPAPPRQPWRCAALPESDEDVFSKLGKTETIIAAAAAHHRLLWIHPFLDGNGRVARLVSHATLLETLDTGGVWSVARGLAATSSATRRASLPATYRAATISTAEET